MANHVSSPRKTGKRGNGEGTIRQRPDGLWEARVALDDGRRKSLYGKTRQEVARKLAAAVRDRNSGMPITPSDRQTVASYVASWLAATESQIKPRTHLRYAELLRLHVVPTLGKVPLVKLTPT